MQDTKLRTSKAGLALVSAVVVLLLAVTGTWRPLLAAVFGSDNGWHSDAANEFRRTPGFVPLAQVNEHVAPEVEPRFGEGQRLLGYVLLAKPVDHFEMRDVDVVARVGSISQRLKVQAGPSSGFIRRIGKVQAWYIVIAVDSKAEVKITAEHGNSAVHLSCGMWWLGELGYTDFQAAEDESVTCSSSPS